MKIIIIFNHFQIQDGVARSAIGMANALTKKPNVYVTLCPLFRYDKTMLSMLDKKVEIKPFIRFYFRGLSKLIDKIPKSFLHRLLAGNQYDIEIGLCMTLPIKIVAADPRLSVANDFSAEHFAWMHGYDEGVKLYDYYKKIGKVVCVSKSCAERLKKETNGDFEIDYTYNLLNDTDIQKMGGESIPVERASNVQFVSVGRMSPEKGYLRLLEICKRLINEGYSFGLWLIGNGPQKVELQEKAHSLGLDKTVSFLGRQNNPHAYTSKADVFICSSFSEGYSTACTEAIMLGIPVITTPVNGGQEIIEEAECGMLVGMSDEELYQGLKMVLDYPKIVNEWKQILKETKYRFSYKNRANRLYHILGLEKNDETSI